MRTDLHLGPGAQAWIVAIYLLTLAVLPRWAVGCATRSARPGRSPSGWRGSPWRRQGSACPPRVWRSSPGAVALGFALSALLIGAASRSGSLKIVASGTS
jgi:hypothetical protein